MARLGDHGMVCRGLVPTAHHLANSIIANGLAAEMADIVESKDSAVRVRDDEIDIVSAGEWRLLNPPRHS